MSRWTFLVAIGLFASPAVNAQAQVESVTGSRIPVPKRARIPNDPARGDGAKVMQEFARCTIDRVPTLVADTLRAPMDDKYGRRFANISSAECLDAGSLRFRPVLMRGALFTELWRRRVIAESRARAWAPVVAPFDAKTPPGDSEEARQNYALLWFADCVVRRDSRTASDFVVAPTGSDRQKAAFTALKPQLGPCWTDGQTLRLNQEILEGAVAEALYRMPTMPVEAKN